MFDLSSWLVGPVVGNTRFIEGHTITVKILPIRERYALGLKFLDVIKTKRDSLLDLFDEGMLKFSETLVALTDAPDALFDEDLTAIFPVGVTVLEVNLDGFFDGKRMLLSESRHKEVRKALSKPEHPDTIKIGPDVAEYWFLWRPVFAEVCTYREMFVDEIFSFYDVHRMHEMLDVQQLKEMISLERD